jgi:calcineurin-like phosphoesterase family protein
MTDWWTADWHFYHKNIINMPRTYRPFKNLKEMHRTIISNHNALVRPEDTVYVIGDAAMLGKSQWEHLKGIVQKLNGIKHLIFGNHDEFNWQRYLDIGFASVHSALWMEKDGINLVMVHDPSAYCAIDDKTVILCGHVHTLFRVLRDQRVVNVGVEVHNFKPISIDTIKGDLGL